MFRLRTLCFLFYCFLILVFGFGSGILVLNFRFSVLGFILFVYSVYCLLFVKGWFLA